MTTALTQNANANARLNTQLDPASVRQAFGQYPSGIVALTAEINGVKEALVASSFTVGVSLEPVLVSLAVQNTSRTWPRLREAERIGISVLADGQHNICRQLAAKEGDRFAGIDIVHGGVPGQSGPLFLADSSLWFETSVYGQFPAGDHTVVLLEVHSLEVQEGTAPVVFHNSQFKNLAR
ncbi:flavin reductase family protein [Micrococcoides hystricis]|uniref:Flavin reductase family protein n=1 Tax=Micrococcoides hystricis TaxID=1572761 RepID=A0ABV6PDH8_9MICC